jgi:hypothetical protein
MRVDTVYQASMGPRTIVRGNREPDMLAELLERELKTRSGCSITP